MSTARWKGQFRPRDSKNDVWFNLRTVFDGTPMEPTFSTADACFSYWFTGSNALKHDTGSTEYRVAQVIPETRRVKSEVTFTLD